MPIPLKLTASVADAEIHRKILGSETTTLVISNEKMKDIKIFKSLEESELLLK